MSKHTPGPWVLWRSKLPGKIRYLQPQEGYAFMTLANADGVDGEAFDANTNLIAAAPDLLEAAEIGVEVLDYSIECLELSKDQSGNSVDMPLNDEIGLLKKKRAKIQAAMKKAKGGE